MIGASGRDRPDPGDRRRAPGAASKLLERSAATPPGARRAPAGRGYEPDPVLLPDGPAERRRPARCAAPGGPRDPRGPPEHLRRSGLPHARPSATDGDSRPRPSADYQAFAHRSGARRTRSLWRVAWDGDEVAGQVRSFINAEENERRGRLRGYTEHISVRRPWRRRGLARALIAASFPLLRARGMTEARARRRRENRRARCGYTRAAASGRSAAHDLPQAARLRQQRGSGARRPNGRRNAPLGSFRLRFGCPVPEPEEEGGFDTLRRRFGRAAPDDRAWGVSRAQPGGAAAARPPRTWSQRHRQVGRQRLVVDSRRPN